MNRKTFFTALMMGLPIGCSTHSSAEPPVIVGGYRAVEVNKEIKDAALFAVQTQTKQEKKPLELVEIKNAQQQVVAGINYQFELVIKHDAEVLSAQVVVYRSLDGVYRLTSWQWLKTETLK